jgi:hypothetical protein
MDPSLAFSERNGELRVQVENEKKNTTITWEDERKLIFHEGTTYQRLNQAMLLPLLLLCRYPTTCPSMTPPPLRTRILLS